MHILEHGQGQEKTLLFLPCTAEPVWAFEKTVALLAQSWHVFQVVYDGHEPSYPGDFTSVEQTVDEITDYLRAQGVTCLDAAYGCSLGGACLTRLLALDKMPVKRAIIDGGITPYQLPYLIRKLLLARDMLSFKLAANNRKILEAAFPPERFTLPGHDPKKEYDAIEAYFKDLLGSDHPQHFLVGEQLCSAKDARKDRHEDHLLVRRRGEEGPQGQYPLHQALFSAGPHPRYPKDGARGACDDLPRGVLPLFR